jgi:hypothetical protein
MMQTRHRHMQIGEWLQDAGRLLVIKLCSSKPCSVHSTNVTWWLYTSHFSHNHIDPSVSLTCLLKLTNFCTNLTSKWDSTDGKVTRLWAERSSIQFLVQTWDFFLPLNVHTNSGAHRPSYSKSIKISFPRGRVRKVWNLLLTSN